MIILGMNFVYLTQEFSNPLYKTYSHPMSLKLLQVSTGWLQACAGCGVKLGCEGELGVP